MINKSSIALDLDGVLTDISGEIIKHISDYTADGVAKCLFHKDGFADYEHVFEKKDFWNNLKPIKESWHKINEWFYAGYDVYFITARRSEGSINIVNEWLDRWNVGHTGVFVTDMFSKHSVLEELKPSVFVDDNPFEIHNIKEKNNNNMESFVMKTWYNEHLIGSLDNIPSLLTLQIG